MKHHFKFKRGDLVQDIKLGGLPYRVERRMLDTDTEVGLYILKRVDANTELLRNGKLVDNPECFQLFIGQD